MRIRHYLTTATTALVLAASTGLVLGQAGVTNNPNTFDTSASTTSFVRWWGLSGLTMTWDATMDAENSLTSGSVQYNIPFTGTAGDQIMTFFTLANRWGWDAGTVIDATTYTNFHFDIKIDPSSAITAGGHYGNLECGLVTYYWNPATTNYAWGTINYNYGNIPLSATNWTRVNRPLNPANANMDRVVGFFFKMWSDRAHTNTVIWNLDNVGIQKPEAPVIIPPPTLTLEQAAPGLAFIAASGGQYDRQNIRTVGSNYSWVGASGPVSYSINVAKHAATNGVQLHMYLVPGISNPGRAASDWHERNVLMWRIYKNADGSAWSELNYKTNAPESNGTMYTAMAAGGGAMGGFWAPTTVGKWTLTFTSDTDMTITAPTGQTLTRVLPSEVLAVFNETPNMQINVGIVPGQLYRVGQRVTLKGVSITGTPGEPAVNSNFVDQPLDTNVWGIVAVSAAYGVQPVLTSNPFWLSWTLPDRGFSLQSRATLDAGPWAGDTASGFTAGNNYYALLHSGSLPDANAGFFRMIKRVGTKLQVLMPGETAAPGTPTGKTGTPTPLTAGEFFSLTVRLVDDEWYPVTTPNDEVRISAPDDAYLYRDGNPTPTTALMMNGVATFTQLQFLNAGSWSVTATDVSRPEILSNTGSPVTVNW